MDTISQEIEKPLLTGDIPGSAAAEHIQLIKNILHISINVVILSDWFTTTDFKGAFFDASVVSRPRMFLQDSL